MCVSFIRSSKDTELFSCVRVMKSGHTRGNVVFMCQPDEGYVNALNLLQLELRIVPYLM